MRACAPASAGRTVWAAPLGLALGVAAVSLCVRSWVLWEQLAGNPLLRAAFLDDAYYLDWARALVEGRARSWFMAPLYPNLLALAGRVAALDLPLACALNVALGAATSAAVALVARALHSARAGWLAGGLHALLPAFVFLDSTPGQEPALALLHVLALATCLWLWRRPQQAWGAGLVLGALIGLAVLGRSTSAALALGAVPALLRASPSVRVRAPLALAVGLSVVLLPAAMINAARNGDPSPLPWGGGAVLYFGNGPESRASISYVATELGDTADRIERRAIAIASAAEGRTLERRDVSAWWLGRTWRERGTPQELALHLARKAALFFSASERGSSHALEVERDFATWLRLAPGGVWWVLAGGLGGWWLLRGRLREVDAVVWLLLGTWLGLTLVFPLARYRLPVVCVMLVPLAAGIVELARGVPAARLIVAGGLALSIGAVAWLPIRAPDPGLAHVNVARAHLLLGDPPGAALARLERVLADQPQHGPAHELYGRVLLGRNEAARALGHLERAARDPRSRFGARVPTVLALVELGRLEQADALAQALLAERRDHPELLAFAALVAWSRGDRARAADHLERARQLAPRSPSVLMVGRRTEL